METTANKSAPQDQVCIRIPERFTFPWHREFRAGYSGDNAGAPLYVLDFTATDFIDSAGLGMILQLAERLGEDPARIRMENCSAHIRAMMQVAGMRRVATLAKPSG